jgi:type 1 glutamine amidotransferase
MKNAVRIFFSLGFVVACSATCEAGTRAKVLLVGKQPDHPFGTHMYLHTCNMLAKCLSLTEGIETIVSDGWPRDATVLDGVSTIVVYASPAAEFLLDAPHRNEVAALMQKGVGLVTIHWASSVRQDNFDRLGQTWLSYLGGTWVSNVGLHTGKSPLKQLRPDHPICRGWKEYELHDEYYLNPTINGEATPLLQVTANGKPVVVGWAYERPGGGRSFGTTLGHYFRNFQDERFRRMIVNAILWTAEVEIPESGARVNLSEHDLALPANPKK